MTNFEPFLVPVDHIQFFGKPFYVSIDVWDLDGGPTDNYSGGQAETIRALWWLLDKTVVTIKSIGKTLIDVPRLNFWINQVVEGW